jgi:methylmalonyl-CoA mutase
VARPGTDGWDVRAWHRDPDPARTRAAALADLEGGATSLWLQLGDGGLAVADLPGALADVYVDLAPIALDAGAETGAAARAFVELVRSRGLEPATVAGTLGADPIGLRARTGAAAELGQLAELAELARPYSNLHVATVDATGYHEAGASDADELAIATAVGVAYLRALTDAGLSPAEAFAALGFRFAVTADQFLSLAKLRAARRIWARVATLSDADGVAQHQHAVTSAAMMTRRDPWVNLLRTTVAGFAAAVAGADAVTVLPFDNALGLPDDFARRLARNTQAILHDESSLGRVADAAGGSGYVEALTEALATRAWDGFTAIERDGGALAALDDGRIAALAAATRERRAQDIAHRRFAITGVSQFALPDEAPLPRRAAPPTPHGGPLAPTRYAEEFEALRDRAEASDPRPAVFLAALGPFATHSARVDFAANLFNAGGLRVVVGPPDDFADSGARVVCLCGSDESYRAEAADLAGALRAAGAAHIWQAGSTAVAGVDDVITAGSDALAVLRTTLEVATA